VALKAITAAGWLTLGALAIIELGAREKLVPPVGFTLLDERAYGAARLVFLRRKNHENPDPGPLSDRSHAEINN